MKRCSSTIRMEDEFYKIVFECQLEKDHKGKHKFEGKSESKLFKVEWWDELSVIEGLSEMYLKEGML